MTVTDVLLLGVSRGGPVNCELDSPRRRAHDGDPKGCPSSRAE